MCFQDDQTTKRWLGQLLMIVENVGVGIGQPH